MKFSEVLAQDLPVLIGETYGDPCITAKIMIL